VLGISLQVRANVVLELRRVVAVMMKMQLDLAEAGSSEPAERREIVCGILLSRKEERMSRRPAIRVPKFVREKGIVPLPTGNAVSPKCGPGPAPERLVVVTHRKEDVLRPLRTRLGEILDHVKAVAANPAMDVFFRETECHHVRIS
jgi:hypothetical protein